MITKFPAFLALGLVVALGAGDVAAQAQRLSPELLGEAQSKIADMSKNIKARVSSTTSALEQVKSGASSAEIEAQVNQLFDAIDADVRGVLNEVSLNSPLMDALDAARSETIVLKRWFERRDESYPNRDRSIGRLDSALSQYDEQSDLILSTERASLFTLMRLGEKRGVLIQEAKIGAIELSIQSLSNLAKELGEMEQMLSVLATAEIAQPPAAADIAQE